jgi:hypothetical protein
MDAGCDCSLPGVLVLELLLFSFAWWVAQGLLELFSALLFPSSQSSSQSSSTVLRASK